MLRLQFLPCAHDLAILAKVNVTDGNRRGANVDDAIVTGNALHGRVIDLAVAPSAEG